MERAYSFGVLPNFLFDASPPPHRNRKPSAFGEELALQKSRSFLYFSVIPPCRNQNEFIEWRIELLRFFALVFQFRFCNSASIFAVLAFTLNVDHRATDTASVAEDITAVLRLPSAPVHMHVRIF